MESQLISRLLMIRCVSTEEILQSTVLYLVLPRSDYVQAHKIFIVFVSCYVCFEYHSYCEVTSSDSFHFSSPLCL